MIRTCSLEAGGVAPWVYFLPEWRGGRASFSGASQRDVSA